MKFEIYNLVSTVSRNDVIPLGHDGLPHIEGYAFKRRLNIFSPKRKCWLVLKGNKLTYRGDWGELNTLYTVQWNVTKRLNMKLSSPP
jgi:hypothetical protein